MLTVIIDNLISKRKKAKANRDTDRTWTSKIFFVS